MAPVTASRTAPARRGASSRADRDPGPAGDEVCVGFMPAIRSPARSGSARTAGTAPGVIRLGPGPSFRKSLLCWLLQDEPVETMSRQGQQVGELPDRGELDAAHALHRDRAAVAAQV